MLLRGDGVSEAAGATLLPRHGPSLAERWMTSAPSCPISGELIDLSVLSISECRSSLVIEIPLLRVWPPGKVSEAARSLSGSD